MRTLDLDYLREGNKIKEHDQSMDGMIYCIYNPFKKQYLRNDFKFQDGTGVNDLNLCDSFSPKKCGWIMEKIDGYENQYSLFSMARWSHKSNEVLDTTMSLITMDFVSPIYKAITNGKEFPFGLQFINPIFSSLSDNNAINFDQFANFQNSWTVLPIDHTALNEFLDENNSFIPEKPIPEPEENAPETFIDYDKIRIKCKTNDDCKKGGCDEKYCESLPFKSGNKETCIGSRRYGQFCSAIQGGLDGDGEAECGNDSNGKQMVCKVVFDLDKMNACRYKDHSQEPGEYCGRDEECKEGPGRPGKPAYYVCTGTDDEKKIGKGVCGKRKNGEPTYVAQTGCSSDPNDGSFSGTCESGRACHGYCTCVRKGVNQEAKGKCKQDEFCDDDPGASFKCQKLKEWGEKIRSLYSSNLCSTSWWLW